MKKIKILIIGILAFIMFTALVGKIDSVFTTAAQVGPNSEGHYLNQTMQPYTVDKRNIKLVTNGGKGRLFKFEE